MAVKGDKTALEPMARRLYADGMNIEEISRRLGVSSNSLVKWKAETLNARTKVDEWDDARAKKGASVARVRDLFHRQLAYMETCKPSAITSAMSDTLSKMAALVERWDKLEAARAVADDVVRMVKKAGLTDEAAEQIRTKVLGIGQS